MKALVVKQPKSYGLVEIHVPAFKAGEVLIRVKNCSICASDFEILYGLNDEEVVYPIIPGHEWSGEVVKAGQGCEKLVGKRVTGSNVMPCYRCPPCQENKSHICANKKELGFNVNGAYAEFIVLPGRNLVELPDALDYQTATLAEPLSVCWHALKRAGMRKESKTLIMGDGCIGLLIGLLARHIGFNHLMLAGHHQPRLEFAAHLTGSATINSKDADLRREVRKVFGQNADLIFEATGKVGVVSQCLSLLERGGSLCLVGSYHGSTIPFNPNDMVLGEQTMLGSITYDRSEMEAIVKMLGDGLLNEVNIITHVFALENFKEAFSCVENRKDNVLKACFNL